MEQDIVEVTGLPKIEALTDEDTLLLIRQEGDIQKCYQIKGKQFSGKSAYEVAKEQGFSGTYEEWQAELQRTTEVSSAVSSATQATTAANNAATKANNAATEATQATTAANNAAITGKAQTDLSKEINEHPTKVGSNGNWWVWNTTTKEYNDTGEMAKGGMLYPSLYLDGNELYIEDNESNAASHLVVDDNALFLVI